VGDDPSHHEADVGDFAVVKAVQDKLQCKYVSPSRAEAHDEASSCVLLNMGMSCFLVSSRASARVSAHMPAAT
jgi:hypothetical protein